jgi:hypothetical protein
MLLMIATPVSTAFGLLLDILLTANQLPFPTRNGLNSPAKCLPFLIFAQTRINPVPSISSK